MPAGRLASIRSLNSQQAFALIVPIRTAAAQVVDYTAILEKRERIGGKMSPTSTLQVKWARPYRFYLKNIGEHNKGLEVLYVRGHNNDELIAHKGSFPDVTVSLDPYGSTAMDGHHHPVTKASLLDFITAIEDNLMLAARRSEGKTRMTSFGTVGDRTCRMVEITLPSGGWYYVVQNGEDLWDIARKHNRNMYQILHHNQSKGWDEPDDPDDGDRVFIPRYYGSKIELCIDRELGLPVMARAYDHSGRLYEDYRHLNLQVNVGLGDRDFDAGNPSYDF